MGIHEAARFNNALDLKGIAKILHSFYKQDDFSKLDPGFPRYFKKLQTQEGAEKYVRHIQNLCKLAGTPVLGKRVLDAGCGYGMTSLVLKMMGAEEVVGIDIKKERLGSFQKIVKKFPVDARKVSGLLMSVTDMAFQDQSFNIILVNEAISHYSGLHSFFSEVQRVLKPGGVLIIADGNNALNPLIKHANYKLWQTYEQGPDGITISGHKIEKSIMTQRREIIANYFPSLSVEEVKVLAERTSGLWGDLLREAVEKYIRTGIMPAHYYQKGSCPRNPMIGSLVEMALNPYELKQYISNLGFKVRIYSHFFGARNELLFHLNQVLALMTPLTIYGARAFRIVAKKV